MRDWSLTVLVDSRHVPTGVIPQFCHDMAEGGSGIIQLRDKGLGTRELVDYGLALRDYTRREGITLIVNDRVDVALTIAADGVHVGQDDMRVSDVRRIAPELLVGLSISSADEIPSDFNDRPDYFGVGPIYPTASKTDAAPAMGIRTLIELRNTLMSSAPVIAIGGITVENVGDVWSTGVDGVAVISAILQAKNWKAAARALQKAQHIRR